MPDVPLVGDYVQYLLHTAVQREELNLSRAVEDKVVSTCDKVSRVSKDHS